MERRPAAAIARRWSGPARRCRWRCSSPASKIRTAALSWTLTFDAQRIDRETAERAAAQFETRSSARSRGGRARACRRSTPSPGRSSEAGRLQAPDRTATSIRSRSRSATSGTESRLRPGSALGTLTMRVVARRSTASAPRSSTACRRSSAGTRRFVSRLAFATACRSARRARGRAARPVGRPDGARARPPGRAHPRRGGRAGARRPFDLSAAPLARAVLFRSRAPTATSSSSPGTGSSSMRGASATLIESIGDTYARVLSGEAEASRISADRDRPDVALWQDGAARVGRASIREANYWRRTLQPRAREHDASGRSGAEGGPDVPGGDARARRAARDGEAIRALARTHRTTPMRVVVGGVRAAGREAHAAERVRARGADDGASARGRHESDRSSTTSRSPCASSGAAPFETLLADVTGNIDEGARPAGVRRRPRSPESDEPGRRPHHAWPFRGARKLDRTCGGLRIRAGHARCARPARTTWR